MPLCRDDSVQLGPLLLRATHGRGVHGPDHPVRVAVLESLESIVGPGQAGLAFGGHPVPAGSEHDCHKRPRPKMRKLLRRSPHNKPDNPVAGDGVVDNPALTTEACGEPSFRSVIATASPSSRAPSSRARSSPAGLRLDCHTH
jgi:hypothetical protein